MAGEDIGGEPNRRESLAFVYGTKLLKEHDYVKLSVEDLVAQGVLTSAQQFPDFIIDRLAFNHSLQAAAFNSVTAYLPPPVDTTDLVGIDQTGLLSKEEEEDIRKSHLLRQRSHSMIEIRGQSELRTFTALVMNSLAVSKDNENDTADPQILQEDANLRELILSSDPVVITNNRQRCYALIKPREFSPTVGGFMAAAITHAIKEYFVVPDPRKNAELSSFIFTHKPLLKYFVAKFLGVVQDAKIRELESLITNASIRKSEQVRTEVVAANFPVMEHFFDLLNQETDQRGPITVTQIFRDFEDELAAKGIAKPRTDRGGAESGFKTVTASKAEDGQVEFTFDYKAYQTPTKVEKVRVRLDKERQVFQFAQVGENNQVSDWQEGENLSGPLSYASSILGGVGIVDFKDMIENPQQTKKETGPFLKQILATASLLEFFAELRNSKFYPRQEYLANSANNPVLKPEISPPAGMKSEESNN